MTVFVEDNAGEALCFVWWQVGHLKKKKKIKNCESRCWVPHWKSIFGKTLATVLSEHSYGETLNDEPQASSEKSKR